MLSEAIQPAPRYAALMALMAGAVLLLLTDPASAATMSGPEVGWTRLADRVFVVAERLGMIVPIIGLATVGAAIAFSFNLGPILDIIIAGTIATLGVAVLSRVMGAELPSMLGSLP